MKQVTVLMSTYNGEKYLCEQIESVLVQQGVEVNLYIRDDGSTDNTISILKDYEHQGKVHVCFADNIGWRKSFMELIYNAPESDYYAFCDQDDIWLPEKLHRAVCELESHKLDSMPMLYGSNLLYYRNGEVEGKLKLNSNYTKQTSLVRALTCGCTMVFNEELCKILKTYRPTFVEAHDSWVFMSALYLGRVVYDPEAYILYRQHDSNQIGAKVTIMDRINRSMRTIKKIGREQSKRKSAEEFLRVYDELLSEDDKKIVSKFAKYTDSFANRVSLLIDNKYSMGSRLSDFFLKLKIMTSTI